MICGSGCTFSITFFAKTSAWSCPVSAAARSSSKASPPEPIAHEPCVYHLVFVALLPAYQQFPWLPPPFLHLCQRYDRRKFSLKTLHARFECFSSCPILQVHAEEVTSQLNGSPSTRTHLSDQVPGNGGRTSRFPTADRLMGTCSRYGICSKQLIANFLGRLYAFNKQYLVNTLHSERERKGKNRIVCLSGQQMDQFVPLQAFSVQRSTRGPFPFNHLWIIANNLFTVE